MEPELKFEKALERLEKIVEDLESGNIPLEDALKKYEEGVKLCRICTQRLSQAETKIESLTKSLNGSEYGPTDGENAKKPERKKTKKTEDPNLPEDEFLL